MASLGGLLVSYGLAATTGLPLLHPEPEPVTPRSGDESDRADGLFAAVSLLRPPLLPHSHDRRNAHMSSHTTRPIPLALTALIAFFSALVALGVSNGHSAHAHGERHSAAAHVVHPRGSATVTRKELVFRSEMRRLWEDHITWTRLAVISLIDRLARHRRHGGAPAPQPDRHRQRGEALLRPSGRERADRQLRLHILIAADVVAAAKTGDADELAVRRRAG